MLTELQFKLAQIANPYFHNSYKVDPTKCFDFIEANKISLLLKQKGLTTKQAEEDEKSLNLLLDELVEIKRIFDSQNIKFVLIKFPKLPRPHGDLDMLIIKNINSAEDILRKRGYVLENDADPYRRTYITEINGNRLEVDLHLEAAWVGVIYLDKEDIWKNSMKREIRGIDVYVPSPEYELLITAAHDMRSNEITLFDVLYVNSLLKEENIDMNFARSRAKKNNWLKQFDYFICVVNEIYRELYELGTFLRVKELPFHFPSYTIGRLKLQKTLLDLRYCGIRRAIENLQAYFYFDIYQNLKRGKK